MIREYKTATTKNKRIKIGDRVIFVPYMEGQKAWYGTVTSIYRIGNSRMMIDVVTNIGKVTRQYANLVYGAERI